MDGDFLWVNMGIAVGCCQALDQLAVGVQLAAIGHEPAVADFAGDANLLCMVMRMEVAGVADGCRALTGCQGWGPGSHLRMGGGGGV